MNDQRVIAIDVVLLPPEEVMQICKRYNAFLWDQTGDGFLFDETHLPHTTLLQQFSSTDSLDRINGTIGRIAASIRPIELKTTGIDQSLLPDGKPFSGIALDAPDSFFALQHAITDGLSRFATDGDKHAFISDPNEEIREGSVLWVRGFRTKKNHHAHISLGVGKAKPLERQITFIATRLAVCHLGNFNTCRKILREWRLK